MPDVELRISPDLGFPVDVVTETLLIIAKRGSGKALALDTPLPTPDGWTSMGEVQVGDEVINETGRPCKVTFATEVQRNRRCYEVTFSDGSAIIADADHLWLSDTLASRRADGQARLYKNRRRGRGGRPQCERSTWPQVLTTEQIRATLTIPVGTSGRQDRNHAIRCTGPVDLPAAALPIDPYVLGVWLGDGGSQSSYITTADPEVLDEIRSCGYSIGDAVKISPTGRSADYRIGAGPDGAPLHRRLREAGLLLNKHVPPEYLRGSIEQRRALLAGLMDSDGTAAGGCTSCVFYNTNEALADAVAEIVASLGWIGRRRKKAAILNGVDHGICHEVRFRPSEQVFRLPRKAARLRLGAAQASRHEHRMIISVEPVPSVPVRCIQVDSPSHLYLAGRSFIPTHNTHTASVLVEEMVRAGLPVSVIDPIGVWWGLRSSADGTGPGLPVTILGGEHADLPLPAESGARVADLVIDERIPVVIDLSGLSKTQQRRFVCDFMERLYHRNRDPLHLVVDEADLFAPLRGSKESARLLGAYEDIVRRGRARGLGCTSITQRPAVLHTDIRSQAEVLIALRLIGTHDVAAIDEWVRLHATDEEAREVKASLPSLPVGTAWVWSPGWLEILARVKIRQRHTFDSSATPKVGQQRIVPRAFARVDPADLERLGARLGQGDEPEGPAEPASGRTVAAETARLRAELAGLRTKLTAAEAREPERVEVPVLSPGELAALEQAVTALRDVAGSLEIALSRAAHPAAPSRPVAPPPSRRPAVREAHPAPDPVPGATAELKPGARRVLEAVARRHPLQVTRPQLAALAGMKRTGGAFQSYFSALRGGGFIREDSGLISVTPAGLDEAGVDVNTKPATAEEVRELWRAALKPGAWTLLEHLIAVHPAAETRAGLAEAVGMTASGGAFQSYLGTLKTNDLVSVSGSNVRAADVFFAP